MFPVPDSFTMHFVDIQIALISTSDRLKIFSLPSKISPNLFNSRISSYFCSHGIFVISTYGHIAYEYPYCA